MPEISNYSSSEILQKFVKHLNSAAAAVPKGTLPPATVNLVLTRVSQINGCAVCVDMHTTAQRAGIKTVARPAIRSFRSPTLNKSPKSANCSLKTQIPPQSSGGASRRPPVQRG